MSQGYRSRDLVLVTNEKHIDYDWQSIMVFLDFDSLWTGDYKVVQIINIYGYSGISNVLPIATVLCFYWLLLLQGEALDSMWGESFPTLLIDNMDVLRPRDKIIGRAQLKLE